MSPTTNVFDWSEFSYWADWLMDWQNSDKNLTKSWLSAISVTFWHRLLLLRLLTCFCQFAPKTKGKQNSLTSFGAWKEQVSILANAKLEIQPIITSVLDIRGRWLCCVLYSRFSARSFQFFSLTNSTLQPFPFLLYCLLNHQLCDRISLTGFDVGLVMQYISLFSCTSFVWFCNISWSEVRYPSTHGSIVVLHRKPALR